MKMQKVREMTLSDWVKSVVRGIFIGLGGAIPITGLVGGWLIGFNLNDAVHLPIAVNVCFILTLALAVAIPVGSAFVWSFNGRR